jgi:hypothetical protein
VANCRENRLVSTVAIALNLLAFPIIAFDVCFYIINYEWVCMGPMRILGGRSFALR